MVSKDVCEKCWRRVKVYQKLEMTSDYFSRLWETTNIGDGWKGVLCPRDEFGSSIRAEEGKPPPPTCPYKLEHAIAAGTRKDK